MFVSVVPNRQSPPAILLREGYRENGKVKMRTLANLSKWKLERIEALRRVLKGEFDGVTEAQQSISDRSFGLLYALRQIADQVGIRSALGSSWEGKLVLFLICARIAHQGSRLSAVRWAQSQAVQQVLGLDRFDEHDLYRALDWLCDQQDSIEKRLYRDYVKKHGYTAWQN